MMFWPAVTLLGFLVLTGLVIAMGTSSTSRYERERELATGGDGPTVLQPVAEPAPQAA